jgi:hypothetical protein
MQKASITPKSIGVSMTNKSGEQGSRKDWEAKVIAHAWKDQDFKRKLLSNPEATLREFGFPCPKNGHFKIIEEKENEYTLVLPKGPANTNQISEKQLLKAAGGGHMTVLTNYEGQKCTCGMCPP